jgi:hypothetical protein
MAKDVRHSSLVAAHWRVVNVLARVFRLVAIATGLGFGAWATRLLLHPELPYSELTVSGGVVLDYAVVGAFCVLIGFAFVTVRPYRPDVAPGGQCSWWTGEPP